MTVYESVIKFDISASPGERVRAISEGLEYAALILIDEYGWTVDQVEVALDNARAAAEDEWYRIHPEPETP